MQKGQMIEDKHAESWDHVCWAAQMQKHNSLIASFL
jgi:hypothetical protein